MVRIHRRAAWCMIAVGLLAAAPRVGAFETVIGQRQLDLEACGVWRDGEPVSTEPGDVEAALGFDDPRSFRGWSGGRPANRGEQSIYHFRIAFNEPVAFGSLMVRGRVDSVYVLKADAGYPGDPASPDQWTKVDAPENQSGGALVPVPAGTTTRAVMVVAHSRRRDPRLYHVRLLGERYFNATPMAMAYASSEYTSYHPLRPPITYSASRIVRGRGSWQSAGENEKGRIPSPPISNIDPAWFLLVWPDVQTITGLWLDDSFKEFRIDYFIGPETMNPKAGIEREWKKLRDFEQRRERHGGRWIEFAEPVDTRGLRLRVTETSEPQIAAIKGLHVITPLGERPAPALSEADEADPRSPPVKFGFDLPWDGNLTVAIDGPEGRRSRNLVTRELRDEGEQRIGWDLTDERGRLVEPGQYTWKAIAHPPLSWHYEMTPYPNVVDHNPRNSPWMNGHSGPGGWLADHAPPNMVCVSDDVVFISSRVAESGVSLLEADLDGGKNWGYHTFHEGFGGPWFLASDGETLFVTARATLLWSFDIATKQYTEFDPLVPTTMRQARTTGMAAKDGKVYLAHNVQAYLTNAASADDVDLDNSIPRYKPGRAPRYHHEEPPDYQRDFLRLLRLQGPVAGFPEGTGLWYLESSKGRGPRQHLVIAFKRPVPIGSLALPRPMQDDLKLRIAYLKDGGQYPPNPGRRSDWIPFDRQVDQPWDVVAAPENVRTRALRLTFIKGEEDLFSQTNDAAAFDTDLELGGGLGLEEDQGENLLGEAMAGDDWYGRLEGLKILRRRFTNLSAEAKIRTNSGEIDDRGAWDAKRDTPVAPDDPAIYAMQWDTPRKVRGLAIKEIDGKHTRIDVYTGPAGGPIDIESDEHWEQVASHTQRLRNFYFPSETHNSNARYLDSYVDFEREIETRAVRLRIVEHYNRREHHRPKGFRRDQGGMDWDATRARIFGVAAVGYLGGEPNVDPLTHERVEVFDPESREIVHETHVPDLKRIVFDPHGELYALSRGRIVKVDMTGGEHEGVVDDLLDCPTFAFDQRGNLYAYDADPSRRVVRVYDPTGKYVRSIGEPGGHEPGAWNPDQLERVTSIDVDKRGQLWVIESSYTPKRVAVFDAKSGEFIREHLGPTAYGSGGALDPYDKSRLIYGPMQFRLDWETGKTRLEALTWDGPFRMSGEQVIQANDREYIVTRLHWGMDMPVVAVFMPRDDGTFKPVAAMGMADAWPRINRPEMLRELDRVTLTGLIFQWSDMNGDGEVQAGEMQLAEKPDNYPGFSLFNRDLAVQCGTHRYTVKRFLPDGVPVYERSEYPALAGKTQRGPYAYRLNDGNFHLFTWIAAGRDKLLTPEGGEVWSFATEGATGHAYAKAKAWRRDQVVAELKWVGHETAHAGDLGEFFVVATNSGQWHIWTADGLLTGPLFHDLRDPGRIPWSFKEHARGRDLGKITLGQEHFNGYFTRTFEDDKYYAVCGHNHASVVEIRGLDRFKRFTGSIDVTLQDLAETQAWQARQEVEKVFKRAPVVDCYRTKKSIRIDGRADEWGESDAHIFEQTRVADFWIAYDDAFLYLCYRTEGYGPMKNAGNRWDRMFKTGAAVDLKMARDPRAPDDRRFPVEGDFRLLMTWLDQRPLAVLYDAVVPEASDEENWEVMSPVSRVSFDRVTKMSGVRLARRSDGDGYVVEAAIPLDELRFEPRDGQRVKMDWGMLVTGPDGFEVLRRVYWANKATGLVSDIPSEAKIEPYLWGYVRFHEETKQKVQGTLGETENILEDQGEDEMIDEFLEELEDDLK